MHGSGFFFLSLTKYPVNTGLQMLRKAWMQSHKYTQLTLFPAHLIEFQEGAVNCLCAQMRDKEK